MLLSSSNNALKKDSSGLMLKSSPTLASESSIFQPLKKEKFMSSTAQSSTTGSFSSGVLSNNSCLTSTAQSSTSSIFSSGVLSNNSCLTSTTPYPFDYFASKNDSFIGLEFLSMKLKDMLTNEILYDMTIKIDEREFHVHRAILATQSTCFADIIKKNIIAKNCDVMEIDDCEPDMFQLFLCYLYCGKIENLSTEKAIKIYAIAHKYGIDNLKIDCVKYMTRNMSVIMFCDAFQLAISHEEPQLLESLKSYFKLNTRQILVTKKWLLFMEQNSVVANELLLLVIN